MRLLTPAIDPGDECAGWEMCPKMILSLMHSVFKTLLFGSDLSKVMESESPDTSFPVVTMTLHQYTDKLPLRKIQKPDEPRRTTSEVVGKFMTFTLHSPSPSTEQWDGKKTANSWFSLGGKKNGT